MPTSAYLIPTIIICDCCKHAFERPLHDVGWISSIDCPECAAPIQLEAGPNVASVSRAMSEMIVRDWPPAA